MWTQTQGIQTISQDSQVWNYPDVNLRYHQPHIHQQPHYEVVEGLQIKVVLVPSGTGDIYYETWGGHIHTQQATRYEILY